MNPENEAVIKNIVWSIRRLVRAVYIDSRTISKQYGLTGPQSIVIRSLVINGSISSADLSRRLYVTPSNITGIIDRLEKKNLVKREQKTGDRRVALITLTEAGAELGRSLPDPIEKILISELADLEPDRVRFLGTAMTQILNLIDVKGGEVAPLELGRETGPDFK